MSNYPPPLAPPMEVPDNGSSFSPGKFGLSERGMGPKPLDAEEMRRLKDQGFTEGLAEALALNCISFPLRIWVVDNSGSMQMPDGHRIVPTAKKNDVKIVSCSRWDEICECVKYHVDMAALLEAPTNFRLLNHPGATVGNQQFGVAEAGAEMIQRDVGTAKSILSKARPGGVTPLASHIRDIHQAVKGMSQTLQREGKRVVIVLATDGLPTDEHGYGGDIQNAEFVSALRQLEGLPVWVVIRLCTDEEPVVDFYNNLDEQLELSLEVLDDFVAEAEEVYEHNKWLNYALPLHRCREMGFHDRVFDLIDERPLSRSELRDFCVLIFGRGRFDGVPDPALDWGGFLSSVDRMLSQERPQWNPVKKKMTPWIDLKKLNKAYGGGASCTIM